ncbi:hypothetical protein Tco_0969964 [Tanacetum coccineum]
MLWGPADGMVWSNVTIPANERILAVPDLPYPSEDPMRPIRQVLGGVRPELKLHGPWTHVCAVGRSTCDVIRASLPYSRGGRPMLSSSVQGPLPVADEDPAAGDRGLLRGSRAWYGGWRAHGMDDRVMVLDDESVFEVGQGSGSAPESKRRERVSTSRQPTLATWTDPEDGMVYIDVPTYPPPPPVQTPPSPEWMSWFISISPSPIYMRAEAVRDEIFSQRYRFRSLEYEQERGENRDLLLQLAEERHARLELAEVVDSMRRGQEPKGGSKCIRADHLYRLVRRFNRIVLDREWSREVLERVVMIGLET